MLVPFSVFDTILGDETTFKCRGFLVHCLNTPDELSEMLHGEFVLRMGCLQALSDVKAPFNFFMQHDANKSCIVFSQLSMIFIR